MVVDDVEVGGWRGKRMLAPSCACGLFPRPRKLPLGAAAPFRSAPFTQEAQQTRSKHDDVNMLSTYILQSHPSDPKQELVDGRFVWQ